MTQPPPFHSLPLYAHAHDLTTAVSQPPSSTAVSEGFRPPFPFVFPPFQTKPQSPLTITIAPNLSRRLLSSVTTIIPRAAPPVTHLQDANQGVTDTVPTPIVIIDQDSDPNATVVKITFGHRLGALLDTMSALKSLGLNVVKANVFLDSSGKHNKFFITKADTGRKVEDPELLEAICLTIINNLIQYHPESSSQLAMGVAFGLLPPKEQVMNVYTFQFQFVFALFSLHLFMYGCNLYMWKATRINHNFIFEFSPTTALKHRDAFLICTAFMTAVVGAMVLHLLLRVAGFFPGNVDAIPGILLLFFIAMLICPLDIFYRPTRFCFIRVIRNIICSPFYKVLLVDFFMADQLTSQIPLLRHLETTSCHILSRVFKTHHPETCSSGRLYMEITYIISFLPYFWRALQCVRRWYDDSDVAHLANMGKYISAMVATGARGFLNPNSRNAWLRDDLVLKNKSIYYMSMALNVVLRVTWTETVMHFKVGPIQTRLLGFMLASLDFMSTEDFILVI
ncbi:unnamed protein product [Vicia faba]|uniref:EXS domain-containing protein n=1 Tax=Vicia faba TaxID=3906 RepID=A0AAV0Z6Z6_VICFA|nr:unnamed protein product [Vicia faba]